ncbi:MAG: hypothetical protein CVU56_04825 [Deltaproteobacteria bacterium HGW-Deltaproteobacteria-14]|nr:MAG: hypothetical protein CVU56_04825 [Deltaproteobacteria bacterium HGW-Deltaproteobacteria-14]
MSARLAGLVASGWAALVTGCASAPVEPAPAVEAPAAAPAAAAPDPDDDLPDEALTVHPYGGPQAGEAAPSLESLAWYRGAPVPAGERYVIFFWGTWCKPCKAALPTLMARSAERGLAIVAVSRDKPPGLDAFFAGWSAPFPDRVAIESAPYPVHRTYEAWTLPRFVYVGGDGTIERVVYGTRDLDAL